MDKMFVDTGWLKGLVDKRDQYHVRSKNVFKKLKKERTLLVTTNFVVAEAFTLVRSHCGLYWAEKLKNLLSSLGGVMEMERVNNEDETKVWNWFWFDWKDLSYTDCTSFAVMERLGLKKVVTFDEHFKMAGFEKVV